MTEICYSLHNDEARRQVAFSATWLTELFQICKDTRAELLKADRLASSLSLGQVCLKGFGFLRFAKMKSKIQAEIGRLIRWQFIDYKIEENIRPEWMTTPEGERLELDFYIPQLEIAFEIQGDQHYKFVPHFHRNETGFADQVRRDQRKRELCLQHDISLIEVATKGEYELAQDEIRAAMEKASKRELSQFVLHRASQQVINVIAHKQRIDKLLKERALTTFPRLQKKIDRKIQLERQRLELNNEIMRYVCVIAIQEFHGEQRLKRRGWEYAMNLRRANKKTEFIPKAAWQKKRPNNSKTVKKWI